MSETHICSKCKEEKRKTEFWVRNDRKCGVYSKCKVCSSQAYEQWRLANIAKRRRDLQEWRKANPERIRKLYRDSDRHRRNTTKEWVDELKSKPCVDCGNEFETFVMDFDHRDPTTKSYVISFMVSKRMPREAILEEIAKCDLICANCHRKRTFQKKKN